MGIVPKQRQDVFSLRKRDVKEALCCSGFAILIVDDRALIVYVPWSRLQSRRRLF